MVIVIIVVVAAATGRAVAQVTAHVAGTSKDSCRARNTNTDTGTHMDTRDTNINAVGRERTLIWTDLQSTAKKAPRQDDC